MTLRDKITVLQIWFRYRDTDIQIIKFTPHSELLVNEMVILDVFVCIKGLSFVSFGYFLWAGYSQNFIIPSKILKN